MNIENTNSAPTTAYSANVTKGLFAKTQAIASEIEMLLLVDKENDVFKFVGDKVVAVVGNLERVPTWFHPIIHKGKAFIDARGYIDRTGNIRNHYEYVLLVRRALLDLAWVEDKEAYFGQIPFVIDAFSSWFSYGLQRNTQANLLTSTNYRIIAAIYYLGLFNNEHVAHDEDVVTYIIKKLPRIINIPVQSINDLIALNEESVVALFRNGFEPKENRLLQLAEILTVLTNEAFTIDSGVIYNSLCKGAFIAANSIDIASIAIEHPPTLIAMMSCVAVKGTQNNTGLGRAVTGILRKHDINSFNKFLQEIAPMEN